LHLCAFARTVIATDRDGEGERHLTQRRKDRKGKTAKKNFRRPLNANFLFASPALLLRDIAATLRKFHAKMVLGIGSTTRDVDPKYPQISTATYCVSE
jgi:hypothetical protein